MEAKVDMKEIENDALPRIVYVRPVAVRDLPQEVQAQAQGIQELFAVHSENGERLALVRDRNLAFVLARQNHMAPVHVH